MLALALAFAFVLGGSPAVPTPAVPDFNRMSPAEIAGVARAMDRTGSPEVERIGAELARRWAVRGARLAPANGMTATDYQRVTVVRDATGAVWGDGMVSINGILTGLEGSIAAYYAAHPGADPDYVVVIQDWLNTDFLGAFYIPVENDVTGIGYANTGGPELFDEDPSTGMEGLLWLNGVQLLSSDLFVGILWGQEFGHRWGSFVHFDAGAGRSDALLGRQNAHWSYFLDTDWSWFEGNDWTDNLDGTFTTNLASFEAVDHYTPLDLYLMGLVGTADVPAFTLLESPSDGSPGDAPRAWQNSTPHTISASPRTVTIQQIVAAEGPRVPSHLASPKSFEVAVVYALRKDDRITPQKVAVMEEALGKMLASFDADVGGRATVTFGPGASRNEAPQAALIAPETGETGRRLLFDASAATDPEGKALRWFWRFDEDEEFAEATATVSHTFASAGRKTVEVSIQDADGGETVLTTQVQVSEGPAGCACAPGSTHAPRLGLLAFVPLLAGWTRRRRGLSRGES